MSDNSETLLCATFTLLSFCCSILSLGVNKSLQITFSKFLSYLLSCGVGNFKSTTSKYLKFHTMLSRTCQRTNATVKAGRGRFFIFMRSIVLLHRPGHFYWHQILFLYNFSSFIFCSLIGKVHILFVCFLGYTIGIWLSLRHPYLEYH